MLRYSKSTPRLPAPDSCCVDEVAAQHVDADFVVHYGHTCLSPSVSSRCHPLRRLLLLDSRTYPPRTARLPVLYVLTKREIDTEHAASSIASTSRASLDEEPPKAIVVLYDVAYAHKSRASQSGGFLLLPPKKKHRADTVRALTGITDLVADALRSQLPASIPVVLSHLDKRANLRSHARALDPPPDATSVPPSESDKAEGLNGGKGKAPARAAQAVADQEEETRPRSSGQTRTRTSADVPSDNSRDDDDDEDAAAHAEPLGFDLEPSVPEPPTTIPRSSVRYDLPPGVDCVDDCALVWIGGESLALNNVLLTHGRCRVGLSFSVFSLHQQGVVQWAHGNSSLILRLLFLCGAVLMQVWSYDPATRSSRLESGRTNRMLMRRYATVEKAKDADVIGILVGTLGVGACCCAAPVLASGDTVCARLTTPHPHSRLLAADHPLAATDRVAPKEELHGRGRQAQPGKVGQLYRGRVLCPRRVPRKLDGRFKGTPACRVSSSLASFSLRARFPS